MSTRMWKGTASTATNPQRAITGSCGSPKHREALKRLPARCSSVSFPSRSGQMFPVMRLRRGLCRYPAPSQQLAISWWTWRSIEQLKGQTASPRFETRKQSYQERECWSRITSTGCWNRVLREFRQKLASPRVPVSIWSFVIAQNELFGWWTHRCCEAR